MVQNIKEAYGIGNGQANSIGMSLVSNTLNCLDDQQKVMLSCVGGAETAQTLDASYYKGTGARNGKEREIIAMNEGGEAMNSVVRRLTPLECTRLQGFPDGWVDIGDWTDSKGKKHKDADSPKYKALGNSIALPFWEYLMNRISAQYERRATLGSLFDGISGFPLAWARCNGPESCRWSSEIEEFPMAVCKKHFGDEEAGVEGDIRSYL